MPTAIILIIEDHEVARVSLCKWLGEEFPHYQLMAAASGEEAVAIACTQELALILMDIGLPGISGIEATRRIKANGVTAPIVMLSIYEDEFYRTEAANAGSSAYVAKPQIQTELIPTMQSLLNCENKKVEG
jgi:CheY-like chemotaxis protein